MGEISGEDEVEFLWTNGCLLPSLVSIPAEHLEQTAGSALLLCKRGFFFLTWVCAGSKAAPTQPRAALCWPRPHLSLLQVSPNIENSRWLLPAAWPGGDPLPIMELGSTLGVFPEPLSAVSGC